ncbi:MAG: Maf family nucleotide pyrophosphatase [Bacteroidota bacterium]|nr:Maf family nucleotide pyrophosphatase [Bacteroidota bacterium]
MKLKYPLILASGSPRRKVLLLAAGFDFEVHTKPTDESFPEEILLENVAEYLAHKKASAFNEESKNNIVVAADTVVICENKFLGKPQNQAEAISMLQFLSGKKHKVITGVCIAFQNKYQTFSDSTDVYFSNLSDEEIINYITNSSPLDKAGAYGIQDWMGYVGIESINGSFYNVMGLPIHKVYQHLSTFKE